MELKDLIINEYYYSKDYNGVKNNNFIFKYLGDINDCPYITCKVNTKTHIYHNGVFTNNITRLATPEEKHHLDICMLFNKYISFEETMESFIKKDESKELEFIYKKLLNL